MDAADTHADCPFGCGPDRKWNHQGHQGKENSKYTAFTTASGLQLAVVLFWPFTTASLKRTEFDRKPDMLLAWKALSLNGGINHHIPNVQLGKMAAVTVQGIDRRHLATFRRKNRLLMRLAVGFCFAGSAEFAFSDLFKLPTPGGLKFFRY